MPKFLTSPYDIGAKGKIITPDMQISVTQRTKWLCMDLFLYFTFSLMIFSFETKFDC